MRKLLLLGAFVLALVACKTQKNAIVVEDGLLRLTVLQLNDVYEIAPLDSGRVGGLARVATLKKQLMAENPNTIAVLCGDFLSPSVFNNVKFNEVDVKGLQMVDAMNAAGIDYVTFGNHEFDDSKVEPLQRALDASNFKWVGGNVYQRVGTDSMAFKQRGNPISAKLQLNLVDADRTSAKIGLFGLCLDKTKKKYVAYTSPEQTAINDANLLSTNCDLVLGLTHQDLSDDTLLARKLQTTRCKLLMGGHDHERSFDMIGDIAVTKADANARTAYVHDFMINTRTGKVRLFSRVIALDEKIAIDAATDSVVQHWMTIAYSNLRSQGYEPLQMVFDGKVPLDARESVVRRQQCPLGGIIAESMASGAKKPVDCAFFNSGSIRIDDVLNGSITQWDLFRILPFGGALAEADVRGSTLIQLFTQSEASVGRGGYLQLHDVDKDAAGVWRIKGQAIDPKKLYHIITSQFLIGGGEFGMEFFSTTNPDVLDVDKADPTNLKDPRSDIKRVIIAHLAKG